MSKILYVHDDQTNPKARIQALEQAGYEVLAEQDGRRCVALAQREKPALVISDVLIHGMTGFELCIHLRGQFSATKLPVILISGIYRGAVYREEAQRVGAQAYALHPFAPRQLVEQVQKTLGAGKSQAA